VVRGAVGEARLENVTVDTGASYTVPVGMLLTGLVLGPYLIRWIWSLRMGRGVKEGLCCDREVR